MPEIQVSDSAINYLKSLAEPFVDTPASVLDRVIAQHKTQNVANIGVPTTSSIPARPVFKMENLPPLLHAKIDSAMVDGEPITRAKWSSLVEYMIKKSAAKGHSTDEIIAALDAQTWRGEKTDTGFSFIKEAGLSFQKLDANRSCKAVLGLARAFDVKVEIDFFWRDNPKAFKPSLTGKIVGP